MVTLKNTYILHLIAAIRVWPVLIIAPVYHTSIIDYLLCFELSIIRKLEHVTADSTQTLTETSYLMIETYQLLYIPVANFHNVLTFFQSTVTCI